MIIPLNRFVEKTELVKKQEVDKVGLLAFYYQNERDSFEFTVDSVCEWFDVLGLHKPNKFRLKQSLSKSRSFVKGKEQDSFRLHTSKVQSFKQDFPFMVEKNEEIESTDMILPASLYENTRDTSNLYQNKSMRHTKTTYLMVVQF